MQRQPESGEILFGISKAIHEKMLQCQKLQKARNDLHAERKVDVDASLCYAELSCMLEIYRQAHKETYIGQTKDRPHFKL